MKTNLKALELIEMGFSSKTVLKLNETQIDKLHSKLMSEQGIRTTVQNKRVEKVSIPVKQSTNIKGMNVASDSTGTTVTTTSESSDTELDEKKESKNNPWAICHAQLGPKKNAKFERCVKDVKKSLKEGKNPVSLFLENKIMNIVEKHIPPRITKSDLIKHIIEGDTKTAPSKPKTNPTTKPGKPSEKPKKPGHPFKNPNPGEKPGPKAKKETNEQGPLTAPGKPATKPTTKPGKPSEKPKKPGHPFKNPNPGEKPSPKARVSPEEAKDKVIDVIMNLLEK